MTEPDELRRIADKNARETAASEPPDTAHQNVSDPDAPGTYVDDLITDSVAEPNEPA